MTAEELYFKPEILGLIQRFRDRLDQVNSWAEFHLAGIPLARASALYNAHYLSKGLTDPEIERELFAEQQIYQFLNRELSAAIAMLLLDKSMDSTL